MNIDQQTNDALLRFQRNEVTRALFLYKAGGNRERFGQEECAGPYISTTFAIKLMESSEEGAKICQQ